VEPLPAAIIRQENAITITCGCCGHLWKVITREALPLNCPQCGKRLEQTRSGQNDGNVSYLCLVHGRFWIDEAGGLRQERRKPGRTP
jgi:hypothetical protein